MQLFLNDVKRMNVLLISPYGNHLNGGIAKWTEHIISYYNVIDGDVSLELLYNPKSKAGFATDSHFLRICNGVQNYYPLTKKFRKIIKNETFDVVHVCSSASFGLLKDLYIVKKAHKSGAKTIVHCHFGRIPEILKSTNWENKLFIRLLRIVDRIIVMDLRSFYALKNFGYEKVRYLPNPLAVSVQQLIEENKNIKRDLKKIVYAGHVVSTKGVFELVEACKQINDIELEIFGHIPNDSIKKQLEELSGNSSNSWLNIKGAKTLEEVIKAMINCSVFVLPSYSEGFPNVILEAMACSCPIVATPVGAIPEMLDIDGKSPCGICVPIKNVEALRQAIVYMLEHTSEAIKLGENARSRVNDMYAIPKVWEQLVGIWKEVATEMHQ